ncbi:MAG: class I SAM-dependent methyltransferase, partial [Acidimicrobiales bacterium]
YHPGGLDLTRRLASTLGLRPGQRVLDVASGPGTTAFLLAAEFGVEVDGVDLGKRSVDRARAGADERGLTGWVRFQVGDAERLPFDDATFDAVVCECAFCTFPDKRTAAGEFARVLKPGGRAGVTDVTLDPDRLDAELRTLAGWVACLADARPAREYAALFAGAGLAVFVSEPHHEALAGMLHQIDARLRALRIIGLSGVSVDFDAVLGYLAAAARAVAAGAAGYHLLVAEKS